MRTLVVVGAGGFGREVLDVVEAVNASGAEPAFELLGVLDDGPSQANLQRLAERDIPYLGTLDEFTGHPAVSFVVGVAHPGHRRAIDERLTAAGHHAPILQHPAATVGSRTSLGPGSIVCAGARLTTHITLGRHVHVHVNATVGHDTTLADFTSVYPLAAVSGSCVLEDGATVGANATVIQGLTVGAGAFVGAGAVVVSDVAPGATVKGVPAH